jgi:undecaprenyl-diphosphatase
MALVTLPVLLCGFFLKKYVYVLLDSPYPSVAGMALGGLAILWAESRVKGRQAVSVEEVTLLQAFGVGLFQCLALWPGVSRSGATIIGGLLLGLDRKAAAEFSFLAGVPVFLAAAAKELHDSHHLLRSLPAGAQPQPSVFTEPAAFALAFVVSFGIALLTVRWFMALLGRVSFRPFGWYRLALSPVLYWPRPMTKPVNSACSSLVAAQDGSPPPKKVEK